MILSLAHSLRTGAQDAGHDERVPAPPHILHVHDLAIARTGIIASTSPAARRLCTVRRRSKIWSSIPRISRYCEGQATQGWGSLTAPVSHFEDLIDGEGRHLVPRWVIPERGEEVAHNDRSSRRMRRA